MQTVVEPLRRLGARIETAEGGRPPLRIQGNPQLAGTRAPFRIGSAQIKSALLLAGLYTSEPVCIEQTRPSRDHTERMLQQFGCRLEQRGTTLCLPAGGRLQATGLRIPGDLSMAAFFMVAASITPGSDIVLERVGINPTRIGLVQILQSMGADIELLDRVDEGPEPVADIRIRYAPLHGIEIPARWQALALDECPALLVAAACAQGETRLGEATPGALATSPRLAAMTRALATLGVELEQEDAALRVRGGPMTAARVDSGGDPRVAMALALAGLRASGRWRSTAAPRWPCTAPNSPNRRDVSELNFIGRKADVSSATTGACDRG